jgi:cell division protein FtsL
MITYIAVALQFAVYVVILRALARQRDRAMKERDDANALLEKLWEQARLGKVPTVTRTRRETVGPS